MGQNPRGEVLRGSRFDIGVIAGAQAGHEHEGGPDFPGVGVDNGDGRPRVVDEALLAGFVDLAEHHVLGLPPLVVVVTELGVAGGVGGLLPIFVPELQQGDTFLPEFLVEAGPIRLGPVGGRG